MFAKLLLLVGLFRSAFGTNNTPKNATQATYWLADNFEGTTFFDNFQFNTYDDPTHGRVCSFFTMHFVFFMRLCFILYRLCELHGQGTCI